MKNLLSLLVIVCLTLGVASGQTLNQTQTPRGLYVPGPVTVTDSLGVRGAFRFSEIGTFDKAITISAGATVTSSDSFVAVSFRSQNAILANGGITFQTASSFFWARGGSTVLATAGTDILDSAGVVRYTELYLPCNVTINGIGHLIGSVGGTDSVMVALYDNNGVKVASSARAQSTNLVGTAANFQNVPFSSPYNAVAGRYFIGVQASGNTAKMRCYPIPGSKFVAAKVSGGTYGTLPNLTPASTFTADVAPICYVY